MTDEQRVNASARIRPLLMRGNLVGLALMTLEDIPVITRWYQNLDFTARLATPGEAHTIDVRAELFGQNSRIRGDSAEFAILDVRSGTLVGFGGLFDITRAYVATQFVAIGDDAHRGRGFGLEASRLICEYGFFFRSLHSIKVEIHAYNRPALRLYERLGFRCAGRIRGANLLHGRRHDEILMDLLSTELELRHVSPFADLATPRDQPPATYTA